MHKLKAMKDTLASCIQAQLADIKNVDAHELGEAVDMLKDIYQSMYYCSIVKAMEQEEEEIKHGECHHHYYYSNLDRDMDKDMGRMYYGGMRKGYYDPAIHGPWLNDGMNYYHEKEFPLEMRDEREGRSPMSRRMYMESKEMHKDKAQKIKELEKYMQELSEDIVEMIEDASTEERQLLEKKMTHLTSKIAQLNQNG